MAAASLDRVSAAPDESALGPGRLVLVVGPSGVGKDSLIRAAREAFAGDEHYVFPRRIVTRPSSDAEDNAEVTLATFERLRREDAFAVSWTAHGLGYGLSRTIDEDIAEGRTVVCNVSRSVVGDLRSRYGNTFVVEVTAPTDILRQRLAARGRPQDGALDGRLARAAPAREDLRPDAVIVNAGEFRHAAIDFVGVIR